MRISDWSSDVCSSDLELEKITALVRSAVGYDETRGDTIEVVEMPFVSLEAGNNEAQGLLLGLDKSDFMRIAELLVLGVVAVLVLLMVVRPLLGRLQIGRASCRERGCQYV